MALTTYNHFYATLALTRVHDLFHLHITAFRTLVWSDARGGGGGGGGPLLPLLRSEVNSQPNANLVPHPAITTAFAGKRNAQELKKLEKTDVKISEARLFNAYATTQNVIEDIEELLPRLSPHHPEIAELLQTARAEPVTPFTIHGHCDDSETKTWPKTDPAVDRWFPNAIE
ncbi:hypothetical protein J4E83_002714 [Alternaria metachromatica]|uniref:uncharacterized protein n=1 Tax=Alternaria metachromatica TaxID=283354 RepID=UPI0020C3387D|nr:uncharacterized protein J4E83_002714 [Alternaria metachromatica]KAI4631185.1 hypothetical protein J4E83_002714 [Alternaria metachromatica]